MKDGGNLGANNLFVIGPHRSGTSALAAVVHAWGLALGPQEGLLPPTGDNPLGYLEPVWLVDFHDELLRTFGTDWQLLTAAAFISMMLPLVVFFALQRYFVEGILAGSVKG